jgi:hypothetical protein
MTVPLYNLTDTWNNSGTVFNGILFNVTNTASASGSRVVDFQLGGTSQLRIEAPDGNVVINQQNNAVSVDILSLQYAGSTRFHFQGVSGGLLTIVNGAQTGLTFQNYGGQLSWGGGADLWDENNATPYGLSLVNSTNAMTYRVYNTYTDASNWERGAFDWTTTSNFLSIGPQALGTGTLRSIKFTTAAAYPAPTTKTTNYSATVSDRCLIFNGSGSITLTLLAAATYPGQELLVRTIAAQTVISASSNVIPRVGGSAGTAILAGTAGSWAFLVSDGTNWQIMAGT